jgi:D-lactate dehydrogenase
VAVREMSRLRTTRENPRRLAAFREAFAYDGDATCATDGLCATSCPVGIDTGKLVKDLRAHDHTPTAESIATVLSNNMGTVTHGMRFGLNLVGCAHSVLGTSIMAAISRGLRRMSGGRIPLWNPSMPRGADPVPARTPVRKDAPAVVYFPSCINRVMGPAKGEADERSLTTVVVELLHRAGYDVMYPENMDGLCCGMPFASKGFKAQGDLRARELEQALLKASQGGTLPVLVDMSPCLYRMKEAFTSPLRLLEPVQFILEHAAPRLSFRKLPITVAVHTTCSAEKMGLAGALKTVAERCAEHVIVPHAVECCGWAGDRGFTVPELNTAALARLREAIPEGCEGGYSTSRTCEIGLSEHSGIPYRSILYLVEKATRA